MIRKRQRRLIPPQDERQVTTSRRRRQPTTDIVSANALSPHHTHYIKLIQSTTYLLVQFLGGATSAGCISTLNGPSVLFVAFGPYTSEPSGYVNW